MGDAMGFRHLRKPGPAADLDLAFSSPKLLHGLQVLRLP